MLQLLSLILLSLILDTIVLNKIAKFSPNWSIIISIARIFSSLIYIIIFPGNDLNSYHWEDITLCSDEIIFKFSTLAKYFYCNDILKDKSLINLIYSFIGTISLSILIRLSKYIQQTKFGSYDKTINHKLSNQFNKYLPVILLLSPNSLFYTSVISKDIFQFCFVVAILYFAIKPNTISFFNLIFSSLFIIFSRPYVFFLLLSSVFLGLILPDFYLKINKFKYIFQFREKYKSLFNRICFALLLLPIFKFLLEFFLPSLLPGAFNIDLTTANEVIDRWNVDMGGNLAISPDINIFIKYIFFWILPIPIFQSGIGALVIGISTLFTLYLIFKILEKGIFINNYKLKCLISIILIYSISFSITMSNTGITSRYRFTTILPILYILYFVSDYQLKKSNYLNNKS